MNYKEFDFLIAFDIGREYCGSSYVNLNKEKAEPKDITSWPSHKRLEVRVPCKISYSGGKPSKFGFTALQHSQTDQIQDLADDKTTADYLILFHNFIVQHLEEVESFPSNLTSRLRYCIIMDQNENLLKEAKITSDTDQKGKVVHVDRFVAIGTELATKKPDQECVICYTTSDQFMLQEISIKNGDVVKSEPISPPTKISSLDDEFKIYAKEIIEKFSKETKLPNFDIQHAVMLACREFKKDIKSLFDFQETKDIFINISPTSGSSKKEPDIVTLRAQDLRERVFKPVMDRINQTFSSIKTEHIYLAGDFVNLKYLKDSLLKLPNNFKVDILEDNITTRGAIHYALKQPVLIDRVAPILVKKDKHDYDSEFYDFDYKEYTHVIGIDFGTSNTKWYYSAQNSSKDVKFNPSTMFIPSLALYDEKLFEQQITGKDAYTQYYKTDKEGKLLTRFKLLLDNYTSGGWEDITAIEAISSYLKSLHKVILDRLKEELKNEKSPKYRYCLTVPAIWGDTAKRMMRQAIIAAGIVKLDDKPNRLMLINEPEAAAQYYSKDPEVLKGAETSRILICDAGGGTVDMAVYDYKKQVDGSYKMKAATAGTGRICGSSFLDDNFRRIIIEKCNEMEYISTPYNIEQMVDQFIQTTKLSFEGNPGSDCKVKINHKESKTQKPPQSHITVSTNDLIKRVFDPIVDDVLDLIREQKNQLTETSLNMIILTGGLGQSKYLQKRVKAEFSAIRVYNPQQYDQSVVRGAVSLALNPNSIERRINPRSYGIEAVMEFNKQRDPVANRIKIRDKEYCKSRFDLILYKGESVQTYEYWTHHYHVPYPNNTYIRLLAFDSEEDINLSTDNRLYNALYFKIDMPEIKGKNSGDPIDLSITFFFGQTEIKVDSQLNGGDIQRHTYIYDEITEDYAKTKESVETKDTVKKKSLFRFINNRMNK